ETIRLKDGRSITAVDLQREFLALAHRYYRDREAEPWVREVLARWENTLDRLAEDPMQLGRELDWVIKRQLIENYMAKHELEWNDSRVAMIDLQFHDIRPGRGLYYKLEESEAVDRIATDDEIAKAIYDPPKDTRAYFRGMCLQRYADEIRRESPHLIPGHEPPQAAPAPEPIHGTTVLSVRFRDGVIMAGDRQATAGYQVASRRIEKIFKSDELSGVGIAGAAGPAME